MLTIDSSGHVIDSKVTVKIFSHIERGDMLVVNGIIIHQTNASTAQSTFNSYMNAQANGAHFLIDKDGKIFQTDSLNKRTNHVGRLKSRCIAEQKCKPVNMSYKREHATEMAKTAPDRYPSNEDSIGIELVGQSFANPAGGENIYEDVTDDQNNSLKWLVAELQVTLKMSVTEVFRHPVVARKNVTEARSAVW